MRSDRSRGRWQPSPFTLVAVSVATALAVNLATNTVHVTGRWWPLAVWISVGILCLIALAIERAQTLPGSPARAGRGLEQATATLAREVAAQWTQEAVLRQVFQPVPLQVRWSSTGRPVAASRDVVLDEPGGSDWRQLPLVGDAGEIVAAFRRLPHRQLVVLGEAGAGKSILAMLLTLGLIKDPEPRQPVPVLLPIASWNPAAESAHDFIVRRLVEEYGFLGGRGPGRQSVAEYLVARGLVLPVLDGMDELPANMHSSAVESLDRFAAADRSLVVTCRSREYEQAVRDSGSLLSRSAVVEIEPVNVEQMIAFLSHPAPGRSRWESVFEHLRVHPDGYLAQVLSTPLMVALARISYRSPTSNPADLLTLSESTALAGRLIDGFVASVYQGDQPVEAHWLRDYHADQAVRWISCLAYHLYLTGTRDLWWWRLGPGLLSLRPAVTKAVVLLSDMLLAAGIGLVLGLAIKPWSPIWAAGTGGLMIAVSAARLFRSIWRTSYPPYLRQWYRSRRGRFVDYVTVRLTFGVVFGLMTGLVIDSWLLGLVGGVACGLAAVVIPEISIPGRVRRSAPRAILRANRRNFAAAAVQHGLTDGAIFAVLAGAIQVRVTALAAGSTAALIYALAAALSAGLWTWLQFRAAHMVLAMRGWLPWRLWAFLDDGHSRGVLRQAGTAWQFRHALLQDHLARQTHLMYLRRQAGARVEDAASRLASLLAGQGRVEEAIAVLRPRADAGDRRASSRLAELLVGQGRVDEAIAFWRGQVDAGVPRAASRLAELLVGQGRVDEAIAFWRGRVDAGDPEAALRLAGLLAGEGRVDEAIAFWRGQVDAGDEGAVVRLANLLVGEGRVEEAIDALRAGAGQRDFPDHGAARHLVPLYPRRRRARKRYSARPQPARQAARRLADLLAAERRVDELRALAGANDEFAAYALVGLLTSQGQAEEAVAILQARVDAGNREAGSRLADLLVEAGRVEEAIAFWRSRADAGDWDAVLRLADLLAGQGRVEEALANLRVCVRKRRSRGYRAARALGYFLAGRGRVLEQKQRVGLSAVSRLADLLAAEGRVDELRARAGATDAFAARALIKLLLSQGRVEESVAIWRALADAGDREAALRLVDFLIGLGRVDEAIVIVREYAHADSGTSGSRLADVLIGLGRVDEAIAIVRALADAGGREAASRLSDLLAGQGRVDEAIAFWRGRVDAGDRAAASRLADLLVGQGRIEEAIAFWRGRADAGDRAAVLRLADLLAGQGRIEEAIAIVRARVDAGDREAALPLADLLAGQGRIDDASAIVQARVDAGDKGAVLRLADLLVGQGRIEEAIAFWRGRVDAGDEQAVVRLAELLAGQGRVEQAIVNLERRGGSDMNAMLKLAELLMRQGRVEEAIKAWRDRVGTHNTVEGMGLSDLLVRQGRVEEAIEFWRDGANAGGNVAVVRFSDLLVRQGRVEEAIEFWRRRLDAGGGRNATFRLADLLAGQGRIDEAIEVLATAVRASSSWDVVGRLASLHAQQHQKASAAPPPG